jgi:hypothetical protein
MDQVLQETNDLRFAIQQKLPNGIDWWDFVIACSPEAAGEIIRLVLSQGKGSPGEMRIEVRQP